MTNISAGSRLPGGHGRGRIGSRSRRRRGARAFIARNIRLIALLFVLLIAGAVCLILFTGGDDKETAAEADISAAPTAIATTTPVPTVNIDEFSGEYNYEGVDESILAGLAGTDESLFTEEEEEFVASGPKIGITLGSVETESDRQLLGKMQEASGDAVRKGLVYEVYCYDAKGSYTQQLQDVRSLIKNEVDVIIVGATDAKSFNMILYMASEEGIPVVAYDAPVDSGYAANVISDQASWGKAYGEFIAQNLPAGKVAQVLGSETSGASQQRKAAIEGALSSNAGISMVGTYYASWSGNAAKEKVKTLIEQNGSIDGIITEEGMAQGVLEAFIEARTLPKVMCGDTTAGFIKQWYALKNGGIVIASPAQSNNGPESEIFAAQPGEFIACAQPAPARAAAVAFEIARLLAEGRTLISEGVQYTYQSATFITDENLEQYYEMIKNMPDDYTIGDPIDAAAESLFNPAPQQ
ncbi:MAG: substrate-binding domain-containing protein [Burkholderiales bacterium]